MNYGQLIDDNFEPKNQKLYEFFIKYFNNTTMHKIKDVNNFSMYMSKTYCLLSRFCRYLIVFVEIDKNPLDYTQKLSDIKWISFQTRTLEDFHNLPPHNYTPTSSTPLMAIITRTNKNKESSTYTCEKFPIEINILHVKNSEYEYQDKGTIVFALETYQTIITIKQDNI